METAVLMICLNFEKSLTELLPAAAEMSAVGAGELSSKRAADAEEAVGGLSMELERELEAYRGWFFSAQEIRRQLFGNCVMLTPSCR